ncbi:MAG TPA: electron transfer flavoprotein-ubiquinone oxidoreductase [Thermoanaerobaculia bacterium]|nr:electron transfer flavoprotein-ubiquinone oxidoreductase [Thermoanaerobaculia bacterium]
MEPERETLELDVLFVGAGPASLAGAYHLARLAAEQKLEVSIAVLEKGKEIGSHALSGAVVDPRALRELFPEDWRSAPFEAPVEHERLLWLTGKRALPLPIPPPLENEGNYVASLGKLLKWMAPKVEAAGVDIFYEFPAVAVLMDGDRGDRVVGVRTGDRGVGRDGRRKANYEPSVDIRAKVTVLGEGPRGTLVKQLEERLGLAEGRNPQVYSIGLKEVWDLPHGRVEPGQVIHTMGWPLGLQTFGGGFVYGMQGDQAIVGLVVGLDYENPLLDPHVLFQRFKTHPEIAALLDGGRMAFYGAKAIPEGGWWAMPRLAGDGFLIVGDSGGLLNSQRLKGIHLAMKSGMLAAETIFEGLRAGALDGERLAGYERKIEESWVREELWAVRNFHQAFDHGVVAGMFQAGVGLVTGGRGWGFRDRLPTRPGHARMVPLDTPGGRKSRPEPFRPDGKLTFDRLTGVYHSGTVHEEDQPVHLIVHDTDVCIYQCAVEYANPCTRFCPAAVYEWVSDPASPTGERLQINASNCVHCKTCDIMDPYEIITWVPPEGGGGPNYSKM